MRILVTGSRSWPNPESVCKSLEYAIMEKYDRSDTVTIIHGGCPRGVDHFTHEWCKLTPCLGNIYVVEEIYRAHWEGPEKRAAGFWRNRRMVEAGADLCMAFIHNESRGATHCADVAERFGIKTFRYLLAS